MVESTLPINVVRTIERWAAEAAQEDIEEQTPVAERRDARNEVLVVLTELVPDQLTEPNIRAGLALWDLAYQAVVTVLGAQAGTIQDASTLG